MPNHLVAGIKNFLVASRLVVGYNNSFRGKSAAVVVLASSRNSCVENKAIDPPKRGFLGPSPRVPFVWMPYFIKCYCYFFFFGPTLTLLFTFVVWWSPGVLYVKVKAWMLILHVGFNQSEFSWWNRGSSDLAMLTNFFQIWVQSCNCNIKSFWMKSFSELFGNSFAIFFTSKGCLIAVQA